MIEKFQIPAVAGIIEKVELGVKKILIQDRVKSSAPQEKGLVEIPGGKIREFENIFDSLRREVFEETGLKITFVTGEETSDLVQQNNYEVIGCEPYFISQNLIGSYPIMVVTFLCKAEGNTLKVTNESENIRWVSITKLREMLYKQPENFYPMYISALTKYVEAQALLAKVNSKDLD